MFVSNKFKWKIDFSPIIEVNNSIITQFELIQRTRLVEALNLSSDPPYR